jgi:hypothetical protein
MSVDVKAAEAEAAPANRNGRRAASLTDIEVLAFSREGRGDEAGEATPRSRGLRLD